MVELDPVSEKSKLQCLECKIIGSGTFAGIGLYALHLRSTSPVSARGHRLFLGLFAAGAFGISAWRFSID